MSASMVSYNSRAASLLLLGGILLLRPRVDGAYQDRQFTETEHDLDGLYQKWRDMEDGTLGLLRNVVKQGLPMLVRASSEMDITDECTGAFLKTLSSLKDGRLWPIKMIDATGKPDGGLLSGTISSYGSYSQCLNVSARNSWNADTEDFRGKYCLVRFRPPLPDKPKDAYLTGVIIEPMKNLTVKSELFQELKRIASAFYSISFQLGLCIPSVCTDEDISQVITFVADKVGFHSEVHSCESSLDSAKIQGDQTAVLAVIGIFVCLAITATFVEELASKFPKIFNYNKSMLTWKAVASFSIPRNSKKIFDSDSGPQDATFSCLNGLRLISICWVVVIHVYSLLTPQMFREAFQLESFSKQFSFQIITSASLSVDTFFFITGVLVANQITTLVDKKGTKFFKVPILIARRLWRLLPSAMMILGLIVILPLLGDGPNWKAETGALLRPTRKNWWTVLACVSNFVRFYDMPMVSLWYISTDVQLFLMALVILAILFRHPSAAYAVMAVLATASVIITGTVIYLKRVFPVFILRAPDKEGIFEQFFFSHTLPQNHVSVYIIGMAVGLFFARNQKPKIPLWGVVMGWLLSLSLLFAALFSGYAFTYGDLPRPEESFFFGALFRTIWGLGLAILTILCATSNGGYLNQFLSWNVFKPLNRLSYLVYLLHVLVITYYFGSLRGVVDCYHHTGVWISAGSIVITFAVAYVMKILFEAPLSELEKLLLEWLFLSKKQDGSHEKVEVTVVHTTSENGLKTKPNASTKL